METTNSCLLKFLLENANINHKCVEQYTKLPCLDLNSKLLEKIVEYGIDVGLPILSDEEAKFASVDIDILQFEIVRQKFAIPLVFDNQKTKIAVVDPFSIDVLDYLRERICGKRFEFCLVSFRLFDSLFKKTFCHKNELKKEELDHLSNNQHENVASVQVFLNYIMECAVKEHASDVHFENIRHGMRIRYRIDGELFVKKVIDRTIADALIAKLKLLTGSKLDETRLPQDKRVCLNISGEKFDIRASVLPTVFGENIALRIFNNENKNFVLDRIGLSHSQLDCVRKLISCQNGLVLLCGPTGCGKTTTLYTILKKISSPTRKVITIEDPIEYRMDDINQVQVNSEIGLTFSSILRSVLRQSPNVIMVGEIRDSETAELAIQAALTGHLVFSTLHCKDSSGAINRLLDLGISENLLISCFRGAISQRLLRCPCKYCVMPRSNLSLSEFTYKGASGKASSNVGCEKCSFRGYNGRMAIFDILVSKSLLGTIDSENSDSVYDKFCVFSNFHDEARKAFLDGKIISEDAKDFL